MSIVEKDPKIKWDYAAYAAIPPDDKRHEIIDGEHFVNPSPNLYHQEVSRHIQFQLYTQIELAGLVLHEGRYIESAETTSITMKVPSHATVDLTRVW